MTSCGKLIVSCCVSICSSSSPLETTAWLTASSIVDSSSDSLRETIEADLGVLPMADVGSGEGMSALVTGSLK
jgi:hypothetical protein